MEIRTINNQDDYYQKEYIKFIKTIFPSADFTSWYKKGFWSENYQPVSLVENGKIVSNIGISLMDILINDKKLKGIQLGGVGTLKEYRKKGYSRKLMKYVLDEYGKKTDLFFLFANDSVLNFYPKFGFEHYKQYIFIKYLHNDYEPVKLRKLNIRNRDDYNLLIGFLNKRCPLTGIFGAVNYRSVAMWHILNFHGQNLFYCYDPEALILMEELNDHLRIYEIISEKAFRIDKILERISRKVKEIRLYFPPDKYHFSYDNKIIYKDSPLFISENINFRSENLKFPELAMT